MADAPQPTVGEGWPPGWADGFSAAELRRRVAFFSEQAAKPGLPPLERRGLQVCVRKYEEAIRAK